MIYPRLPGKTPSTLALLVLLAIPTTPLRAATYYVSPSGDDQHPGTRNAPLQTINAAADRAVAGDTVFVMEGVYRERVTPPRGGRPGKPIVYQGEPGKRVVVKGSEIWRPNWKAEGSGTWSAKPSDAMFDDRSKEFVDHYNPLRVQLSSTPWNRAGKREHERGYDGDECLTYTCGQVFVDGAPLREVPFRVELTPGTWHYDASSERVLVHFGDRQPTECEVELTTRRRIFAPEQRGLGYIVVQGFLFEHCGNQYPTNFWSNDANAQKGAIGTEAGHHWTIRRNVIRYAKTFAIDVGRVDRHSGAESAYNNLVEENFVIDNGSAGILSSGSRNLVIRNNVVIHNNRLRFLGPKRWEQAGIKCHSLENGLIESNYVAHNCDTYGIWLDNQFPDARVSRNVIHHNGRAGIFLEMSDYDFDRVLVDNNLIFDNAENAIYIHDASGATFANNLLANTGDATGYGQAVYIRQVMARTKTYHHSFYGNLMIGNARNVEVNYPAARSGAQRFDFNLYDVDPQSRAFVVSDQSDMPSPWSGREFRELIQHDLELTGRSPHILGRAGKAMFTIAEWKQFWQQHGESNDQHSQCMPDNSVSYDPVSRELTIKLVAAPPSFHDDRAVSIPEHFRNLAQANGTDDGFWPLATLKQGENRFVVWDRLPRIGSGELPPVEWTEDSSSK